MTSRRAWLRTRSSPSEKSCRSSLTPRGRTTRRMLLPRFPTMTTWWRRQVRSATTLAWSLPSLRWTVMQTVAGPSPQTRWSWPRTRERPSPTLLLWRTESSEFCVSHGLMLGLRTRVVGLFRDVIVVYIIDLKYFILDLFEARQIMSAVHNDTRWDLTAKVAHASTFLSLGLQFVPKYRCLRCTLDLQ